MATIELYASKVNFMPGLIKDVKKSVKAYNSELSEMKKKALKVDSTVCNLGSVIQSIQTSSQTQEKKMQSLDNFREDTEQFIRDANRIDDSAASTINKNKKDFYKEYSYLKPDCEKSGWEKFWEGCKKVGQWCADHWEEICVVLTVVAAVVLTVVAIATFGIAAVALAAAVGAIVGVVGQLVSDVISIAITKEVKFSSWQSYVGAAFGGAFGGLLTLVGCPPLASGMIEAGFTTIFTNSFNNLTGGEHISFGRTVFDTVTSVGMAGLLGSGKTKKKLDKLSGEITSGFTDKFPRLKSGSSSYGSRYKAVMTGLKNKSFKSFSWKSVRNGVMDQIFGDSGKTLVNGVFNIGRITDNCIASYKKIALMFAR